MKFLKIDQDFDIIFKGFCSWWRLVRYGWGLRRRKVLSGLLADLVLKELSFWYLIYKICSKFILSFAYVTFLKFRLSLSHLRFLPTKSCQLGGLYPSGWAKHSSSPSSFFYLVPRKLFIFLQLKVAHFVLWVLLELGTNNFCKWTLGEIPKPGLMSL